MATGRVARGQLSEPILSQTYSSTASLASSSSRSGESQPTTVSRASSSVSPSSRTSSPRKPAASLRASRRCAERAEGAHQEVAVGDRLAEIHRAVPGGQQGEIVLVEVGERAGVLGFEFLFGDLVDPRTQGLSEDLATGLAADRFGNDVNRISRIDETK